MDLYPRTERIDDLEPYETPLVTKPDFSKLGKVPPDWPKLWPRVPENYGFYTSPTRIAWIEGHYFYPAIYKLSDGLPEGATRIEPGPNDDWREARSPEPAYNLRNIGEAIDALEPYEHPDGPYGPMMDDLDRKKQMTDWNKRGEDWGIAISPIAPPSAKPLPPEPRGKNFFATVQGNPTTRLFQGDPLPNPAFVGPGAHVVMQHGGIPVSVFTDFEEATKVAELTDCYVAPDLPLDLVPFMDSAAVDDHWPNLRLTSPVSFIPIPAKITLDRRLDLIYIQEANAVERSEYLETQITRNKALRDHYLKELDNATDMHASAEKRGIRYDELLQETLGYQERAITAQRRAFRSLMVYVVCVIAIIAEMIWLWTSNT